MFTAWSDQFHDHYFGENHCIVILFTPFQKKETTKYKRNAVESYSNDVLHVTTYYSLVNFTVLHSSMSNKRALVWMPDGEHVQCVVMFIGEDFTNE